MLKKTKLDLLGKHRELDSQISVKSYIYKNNNASAGLSIQVMTLIHLSKSGT